MMVPRSWSSSWTSLCTSLVLLSLSDSAHAQQAGSIAVVGETLVSGMMMIVGNEEKVYILDKVENNPTQIDGHPAWAAEWDIASNKATPMPMNTNTFCASGMHLPNGSYATFGGNSAVTTGGASASPFDPLYGDYDGSLAIRILNPCTQTGQCQWFDNSSTLAMQTKRWYSAAESLADGSVAIIGGFVNGGYVNRNFPNTDPATEGGAAEPTYEFYPANGRQKEVMQFMITTSGLNAYAHTALMKSGLMFVQANLSTILWDYNKNQEFPLPDMPNGVARVYPASGAVAMLPLTPASNYTPTMLFCGGSAIPPDGYGSYAGPNVNPWEFPASQDCQRITPEPTDGSQPAYVQDDNMLEGRTMGQFIILPDGNLLVINGGANGTAGYGTGTALIKDPGQMPFSESYSTNPTYTPALYNPNAPAGSRWTNTGFQASAIPRLYHSAAILLPDASVMIAGSNPNLDYNNSAYYATEYRAEIFYPSYWGKPRPQVSGIPSNLTYGGNSFDLTVAASSYSGDANSAAGNTTVVLMRPGFTTHAMNMGQRMLQLNNTYTVGDDGTITLHVSQVPPFPTLLTPGPVFMHVVVNGVPSNGSYMIVGSGSIEAQQVSAVQALPPVQLSTKNTKGSSSGNNSNSDSTGTKSGMHLSTGLLIGSIAGGVALLIVLATLITMCVRKRKGGSSGFNAPDKTGRMDLDKPYYGAQAQGAGSDAFVPLKQYNESSTWNPNTSAMASSASFLEHDQQQQQLQHPQAMPYNNNGMQRGYSSNEYVPTYDPYRDSRSPGPGPSSPQGGYDPYSNQHQQRQHEGYSQRQQAGYDAYSHQQPYGNAYAE